MSEFTKTAIYTKLTGDATLATLLGHDENAKPAVFNANMNQKQQSTTGWTYPCITVREDEGSVDQRFVSGTVEAEYFDIEAWWPNDSALTGARILARIDALLHNATLTLSTGVCYNCVRVSKTPDLYDDKLKVHFGLYRYRLVVGH